MHSDSVFKVVENDLISNSQWIEDKIKLGSVPPFPWSFTYLFSIRNASICYRASPGCATLSILRSLVSSHSQEFKAIIDDQFGLSEEEGNQAILALASVFRQHSPFSYDKKKTYAFRVIRDPADWILFVIYRMIVTRINSGFQPPPRLAGLVLGAQVSASTGNTNPLLMDTSLRLAVCRLKHSADYNFATNKQLSCSDFESEDTFNLSELSILQYRLSRLIGASFVILHLNSKPPDTFNFNSSPVENVNIVPTDEVKLRNLAYLSSYEARLLILRELSGFSNYHSEEV
jgi:hypothetical protein